MYILEVIILKKLNFEMLIIFNLFLIIYNYFFIIYFSLNRIINRIMSREKLFIYNNNQWLFIIIYNM